MKNHAPYIKAFAKCHADKNIMPDIIIPKVKKKTIIGQRKARGKNDNPEERLQKKIINWLRIHHVYVGKVKVKAQQSGGRYLKDNLLMIGVPDLIAFNKSMWWVEVKTPTGRLSPEQQIFQDKCKQCGVNHIVARSLMDIEPILKEGIY